MNQISLFTPGPTYIPQRILDAMSFSELHHRTGQFKKLFRETADQLQELFQAEEAPLFLACSGTGGMEAVIANTVSTEDHLGYLDAGKFGERWGAIAEAKGLKATPLKLEWGASPSVEEVRAFLKQNPGITHFAIQYSETSTTVLHDVPAISAMIHDEFPDVFILVDAISAATTLEINLGSLFCDALILASQKAFMLPPGLSMVFLSSRFWDHREGLSPTTLYLDLKRERSSQAKDDAAWTPAVSLIAGLKEALNLFAEEGWQNVYSRHKACRDYSLDWFSKLDITPINATHASTSVTGGFPSKKFSAEELRSKLYSNYGIRIAGGQDHWKGKVLRFGHMGVITPDDLKNCFVALQELLNQ